MLVSVEDTITEGAARALDSGWCRSVRGSVALAKRLKRTMTMSLSSGTPNSRSPSFTAVGAEPRPQLGQGPDLAARRSVSPLS
jgi:hypothetical protein